MQKVLKWAASKILRIGVVVLSIATASSTITVTELLGEIVGAQQPDCRTIVVTAVHAPD